MGKTADPSPRKRGKVEALLKLLTMSQREIAKFVGMSQKAVHTIKNRLDCGLTSSPKRTTSGRKKIITPRARRVLVMTCRKNRKMTAFMKKNKIPILPWPGNSPDMNPIENLWMIVKRRIAMRKPTNRVTLIEALIDVWARDPEIKEMCPKLIQGMPKRIELLIQAKGASTKY